MSDELTRTQVEEGTAPHDPREEGSFRSDSHSYGHGFGSREHSFGFGRTAVDPGMSFRIGLLSSVTFRPRRLVIPKSVGKDFILDDLTVDGNSQFQAGGRLPAAVFSEQSFGVKMVMDVCQVNSRLVISGHNISGERRIFMAALIGPVV